MSKNRLLFLLSVFVFTTTVLYFCSLKTVSASSLTGASVTISNSRMSYKAPVSSGAATSSLVTISGAAPDTTTRHLFPGDAVCFTDAGNNVCRDNKTYTVVSVPSDTTFNLSSPLITALTATDYVVATQSGTWTIGFTLVNAVPVGGKINITIPANDANATGKNNDGMPDSAASIATNGFDMNKLVAANAAVTAGCTPANWGTGGAGGATSITPGGGGTTDTIISWTRANSSCAGGTAITISVASPFIVNPAPITGHVQGTADVYGIAIATTDGTNTLDTATPRVAPVEAVLISANVDESLSLVVAGLGAGTYCGNSQTITTTATSIPWGHLTAPNTFYYAAQSLTVNTNATSGYAVTIQENDQMGRNGNVCTDTSPSAGDYTFGSATCIRDTVCQASSCSESTATDWLIPTGFAGLGYSEASISGTDAPFYYNEKNRSFSTKQIADTSGVGAGAETPAIIMSNSGPVSGSSIYICYRITIPGTQPSGYYYNIAKYTATVTF
jgi:hypothetical protein